MAEATIDELQIEISTTSGSAADNLEKLAQKLERLESVVSPLTSNKGLEKIAKQLDKLSAVSQRISGLSGFEKIGQAVDNLKKIEQLNNIRDISPFIRNLNKIPQIVTAISQMPSIDSTKFRQLANALKPLSSINSSGINSLVNSLRKIPKLSQELSAVDFSAFSQQIQQIAQSIEPLARQAQSAGAGLQAIAQIMRATGQQAQHSSGGVSLFNTAIGNIKVKTLAAMAALRRLFSALKNAVTASAAYVENLNLFRVTMGESADEALRFAESVNAALGVDTSDWIRYQGIFQSIGKGFGVASSQADTMSKNLTQLSYDISSFYNISVDTAAMKLQSAMSGQVMPMRELGFAIEETTLKQVAYNHGVTQSVETMTQAQKAQLRYVAMMEQAGNIGVLGDMARTIDTASNGMRVLEARIHQFSRAVGNMLMPMLSAVLPYATAFVQVLTEGAQAIANLFGFELPKIDFSGASVSTGYDDITSSIDNATEASEKFKGSLASIDQLNIIGSETENKTAAAGNQFDLGIELPEYDFLQGVESKTKQIADDIKNWFKEALPWIEAVGTAILGVFTVRKVLDFVDAITRVKDIFAAIEGTKLSGAAKAVTGIAGGLAAGATSGVLLFNGIKNLITGTGKLGNNWAMVGTGIAVAGGAIAAFIALGNPVGAVITGIGALVGVVAGAVSEVNEEIDKCNKIITDNILYHNGGTKITEIATAFDNWADAAMSVNQQTIDKYNKLDEYDTKIDSVLSTMQEISGINIDFSGINPADAEALKEPFNTLVTYLQGDFKTRCSTALGDLKKIFLNLGLGDALTSQFEEGFEELNLLFDTNLTESQKVINQYLDKLSKNGSLSDVELEDFSKKYTQIQRLSLADDSSWQDVQTSLKALNEIDLSTVNFETDNSAKEALADIIAKKSEYEKTVMSRFEEEKKNLDVMRDKLSILYDNGNGTISLEEYKKQLGLLDISQALFATNAINSLDDINNQVKPIYEKMISQLGDAASEVIPNIGDYVLASIGRYKYDNLTVDELAQEIATGNWLNNNELYNTLQSELSGLMIEPDINISVPEAGTPAFEWYKALANGGILPMTTEVEIKIKNSADLMSSSGWSKQADELLLQEGTKSGWSISTYEQQAREFSEASEKAGKWIEAGLESGWDIRTFERYTRELADVGSKAFCEKYGIHSPSTLFENFGGYMMKGLENGITGGFSNVLGAQGALFDKMANQRKQFQEQYEKYDISNYSAEDFIPDLSSSYNPPKTTISYEQSVGVAREAKNENSINSFDTRELEATVPVTVQVWVDNDMLFEKFTEEQTRLAYRNNGR